MSHKSADISRLRLLFLPVATVSLLALTIAALSIGRYYIPITDVVAALISLIFPEIEMGDPNSRPIVLFARLPRILTSILVGSGLAVAGTAMQAIFRNPLVSPQILGVSSAASVGGVLAILLGFSSALMIGSAIATGLISLVIVFGLSRVNGQSPQMMLLLSGVVASAFFSALVSIMTYIASPENQLPTVVFWLMGSFSSAGYPRLLMVAPLIVISMALLVLLRWRINVLALGEDSRQLMRSPEIVRWTSIVAVTVIVAAAVSVSGVIGWVGLVVPHLTRIVIGADNRYLIPATIITGAIYLLVIDTVARAATSVEVPIGILTALIGAPIFFYLLRRFGARGWGNA